MNFKFLLCLFLSVFLCVRVKAQEQPNREFRGVWVATVANLDWPKQGDSAANQKLALQRLFDKIKDANLNVVLFQVRTECDAFYKSSREPWSRYLTGKQGIVPEYDPLAFAIEEAHKRGLELHAWFNPYRVNSSTDSKTVFADNHISKTKPEWLLSFANGKKILNPGLPEVREYVAQVVREVAQHYTIDGVHFDDYFYPYPEGSFKGIASEDAATFAKYGKNFKDIKDWRRDNVNETMRLVHQALKATKPEARFGVSPFGIWKTNVPAGIKGMDAYNDIYADPLAWLEKQYVDYLSPQLYWVIGGNQDYRKLLEWWSDKTYSSSRHLYAGHSLLAKGATELELPNQIAISRANQHHNALGSVIFRATNLTSNTLQSHTSLKATTFMAPAAPPAMPWKPGAKPAAPTDFTMVKNEKTGDYHVSWKRPARNKHSFKRYMLYSSFAPVTNVAELPAGALRAIPVSESFTVPASQVPLQTTYWAITELGPNNIESELSNFVILGRGGAIAQQLPAPSPEPDAAPELLEPLHARAIQQIKNVAAPNAVFDSQKSKVATVSTPYYLDVKLKKKAEVKVMLMSLDRTVKTEVMKRKFKSGVYTLSIDRSKLEAGENLLVLTINNKQSIKKIMLN
ncbi:family 10 glycosylhydrolase [Pontibacter qinzhouensis]|uniref:Family 10 glycosylhydrolase n=1 Tax=Pontibacter qinzhouensis TaxID=2603253 RepID=A0A5C8KAA2_9BACT|nr:family 10 glycosylhydrolase [Pontibacter qinzhouensis]TXK51577.1 family 10 glycosylhydrolase [Pontibacter qinzhouensis]